MSNYDPDVETLRRLLQFSPDGNALNQVIAAAAWGRIEARLARAEAERDALQVWTAGVTPELEGLRARVAVLEAFVRNWAEDVDPEVLAEALSEPTQTNVDIGFYDDEGNKVLATHEHRWRSTGRVCVGCGEIE